MDIATLPEVLGPLVEAMRAGHVTRLRCGDVEVWLGDEPRASTVELLPAPAAEPDDSDQRWAHTAMRPPNLRQLRKRRGQP